MGECGACTVLVDGVPARLGDKVNPYAQVVEYDKKRVLPRKQEYHTLMLNKPRGYVTTVTDPQGRKCVTDLLTDFPHRVYPVGRLDMVSEGMLLLTDDGELANRLTHPSHHISKLYRVKVAGSVSTEQLAALEAPMVIDDYETVGAQVMVAGEDETGTVLKITLTEGRNRQIRKMCEQVHLTVKRLSRISIGKLKLNGLPVGKWRELTEEEMRYLLQATDLHR